MIDGVEWQAFERAYGWVPDLDFETPSANGESTRPDLAVLPRTSDIAMRFSGYLLIPQTGDYTFHLSTDARAYLRIHDMSVLDADYGYISGSQRSASVRLAAGLHPYRLDYARGTTGTPSLALEWSGPGFAREAIPDSTFKRAGSIPGPPEARNDEARALRDTAILIAVLANDSDDGTPGPLAITTVSAPMAGTATVDSGQIRYTPQTGFLGVDRFHYTISDGAQLASATVTVTVVDFDAQAIWMPLNEHAGNTLFEAGGMPLGTLLGHGDPASAFVPGKFGRALRFDGNDDQLVLDSALAPPPVGAADRTVAAWIRAQPGVPGGAIIAWGTVSNLKFQLLLEPLSTNTGALHLEGPVTLLANTDLRDGTWHHLAATSSGSLVTLYVDGVSVASGNGTANTALSAITIGTDGRRPFTGDIDEVRVYHRALDAAEIAALAAATEGVASAWWRRNVGSNTLSWTDDPDGDGIPLHGEFAFGGSPWFPDAIAFHRFSYPGEPQLEFTAINPLLADLPYSLMASSDLRSWHSIDFQLSYIGATGDAYGLHRAVIPNFSLTSTPIFMRLELSAKEFNPVVP